MKTVYILLAIVALIAVFVYLEDVPPPQDTPTSREYSRWKLLSTRAEDGEVRPSFIITATQGYKDAKGNAVTPTMLISCSHGTANASFEFEVPVAKPRGELAFIFSRALVDGESFPLNLNMSPNKPSFGIGMGAKDLVRRMSFGEEMIVEIEDALITPNRMIFDIRGFDRAVRPFEARCGIR